MIVGFHSVCRMCLLAQLPKIPIPTRFRVTVGLGYSPTRCSMADGLKGICLQVCIYTIHYSFGFLHVSRVQKP